MTDEQFTDLLACLERGFGALEGHLINVTAAVDNLTQQILLAATDADY